MANLVYSQGTTLSYKTTGESATFVEIEELVGTPDIGGAPEIVDTSNLKLGFKRQSKGMIDYGTLEFEFWMQDGVTGNYQVVSGLEDTDNSIEWKLTLSNGVSYTWTGTCYTTLPSIGNGTYEKFKLGIVLDSAITKAFA